MTATAAQSSQLESALDCWKAGRLKDAETLARRALQADPGSARALNMLGGILVQTDNHALGLAFVRRSITLDPGDAFFYNTLAAALLARGDAAGAVESFRRSLEIEPQKAGVRSNLLLAQQYVRMSPELALEEAREWGRREAHRRLDPRRFRSRPADPQKRIRLGYVSADFHRHPVGYFMEPVLASHDRERFEVFCYSNQSAVYEDTLTETLRRGADRWRDVATLTHDALAQQVEQDEIDVLVDLSGHTAHHRLQVFSRRVAPVQVSWLGYCGTTGVPEIDYLLVDRHICPPGSERFYSEECVRLPDSFLCYRPQWTPDAPRAEDRPVTFGCFNKLGKITPEVVAVWSRILHRVACSRICLMSGAFSDASVQQYYRALFAAHGIGAERLDLFDKRPFDQYMRTCEQIDVALDPFPFNGCTTTVEALSAGTPVVSLACERYAGRMGLSILSSVGLPDLVASTVEGYVDLAVALAGDAGRRADLRRHLPGRMAASPLCDGERFARGLEDAYRQMWTRWCHAGARA